MIITLKGCTATAFIGGLNFFKVSKGTVSGADVTISASTINKDEATSTSARDIAIVALKSNYENLVVTVTMGGTTVNWYAGGKVTIPANTTVTGDIKISASATAVSGGGNTGGEDTGLNSATTAFINAANITDESMISKIDTMVKSLISEGLWDKIDALYPCVGTTFEQMSYNLKDPSTFKMRTPSGVAPSVDNTGILSDQLVVCDNYTTAPGDDFHTLAWNKIGYSTIENLRIAICGVCIGEGLGDGGVQVQFYDNGTDGQAQVRTHGSSGRWNCKPCDVNPTGLVISSLTSGIIHNGVSLEAVKQGTPNLTITNVNIGINGMLGGKNYLGHRGLVGFGKGLTIEEMQTYSEILNTFKNIY